jgi:2-polyprenyl-3-methyl-5-hydroxy-6-metoxy-1,4-benzoquinol methylase
VLRRRCPLCDAQHARPAWTEAGYRYVRCSRCRTLYADVDRSEYESQQHNDWHKWELSDDTIAFYGTARQVVHAEFLDRYRPTGTGRLLDVGCGLGFFISRALAQGWDAFGCDTSDAWVARARERASSGRVWLGGVEEIAVHEPRFDLITAWDVLEHVFDPRSFLKAVARLLAPGGTLFIRTPNEAWVYPTYGLRRLLLHEQVELGPLNHVVYYRAATLRRALRVSGLKPLAWPVLPPPQVGYANRRAADAGRPTLMTRVKNAHARAASTIASGSAGAIVLGADLDVVAVRAA